VLGARERRVRAVADDPVDVDREFGRRSGRAHEHRHPPAIGEGARGLVYLEPDWAKIDDAE
jgi:hypothetical protein